MNFNVAASRGVWNTLYLSRKGLAVSPPSQQAAHGDISSWLGDWVTMQDTFSARPPARPACPLVAARLIPRTQLASATGAFLSSRPARGSRAHRECARARTQYPAACP